MPALDLRPIAMDAVPTHRPAAAARWLWHGFLMPGEVTLLTSRRKTGKTTLLAGLLRHLGAGTPFLGRAVRPGRGWVVSEESIDLWADRLRRIPVGPHATLLARPFRGRPTSDEWTELLDRAADAAAAGELDLFVVDLLASFLPGRCESDAATLLEALHPLRRLTAAGAAVLLLHHPRKEAAEAGSTARGSGALLGFVDVAVELTPYSRLAGDRQLRLLRSLSRRPETPAVLAYEWTPETGEFQPVTDPRARQFVQNWPAVLVVLQGRRSAVSHKDIRAAWPADQEPPAASSLYDWLNHAYSQKLVRREGCGTSADPFRYRLTNADDAYWDRGELPPLR